MVTGNLAETVVWVEKMGEWFAVGEPPDKPSASTAPLGMALGEGRYDRLLIVSFASSLLASPKLNDMVRIWHCEVDEKEVRESNGGKLGVCQLSKGARNHANRIVHRKDSIFSLTLSAFIYANKGEDGDD